jgi:ferrochelatase
MNLSKTKTGVLLVNLGTPDTPTPWGVMKFLRAFLSDKRVVEIPQWLWRFILYGVILPFRSFKVAKNYQRIWTSQGSPLRTITKQLAQRLSDYLSLQQDCYIPVVSAMTYGNPSIKEGISILNQLGISRLIVVPLFPYYSGTTTAAVLDALARQMANVRAIPSIFFIHQYGLAECYLDALVQSIVEHWRQQGRAERLLFSFHGIPKRNERLGDPYSFQCKKAAERLAEKLNIAENYWEIGFQSRFGFNAWLTPATDELLVKWAKEGIQSVDVVSPSFAVECLETLEELGEQSRHLFLKAGGKSFRYIPALNDSDRHVRALGTEIEIFFHNM